MRTITTVALIGACMLLAPVGMAQSMWRCPGGYYTNNDKEAYNVGGCERVTSDSVSVIPPPDPSTKVIPPPPVVEEPPQSQPQPQVESPKPDPEVEKRKARERRQLAKKKKELEVLQKEYKNGEPDKMGPEFRNYQKYLDRVERMKKDIDKKNAEIEKLQSNL